MWSLDEKDSMNSKYFKSRWRKWVKLTSKQKIIEKNTALIQKETRMKKGVYIVRVSKPVDRVIGKSDIVYIGEGTLHRRLRRVLKVFPERITEKSKKQKNLLARWGLLLIVKKFDADVWITYKITNKHKDLEKKLLQKYRNDHIENPPLNSNSR